MLLFALVLLVWLCDPLRAISGVAPVDLTEPERKWLSQHTVIRLAPDPEFAPIEFFDDEGRYQGVAADHIRLLEKKLGIQFQVVRLKNWDEVMEKFHAGDVDVLGAIVATPNRRTFMRITHPLLRVPGAIMVRTSVDPSLTFDKLTGMTVAVVSNYTAHDIMRAEYPDVRLDIVPSTIAGLTKVSFGMVDVYVENLATATYYLHEAAISNVHAAGATPFTYEWGIGIRKDWPELERILNKGIASIGQEERKALLDHWLPVRRPWEPTRKFIGSLLAGGGGLGLCAILLWNWLLRRRVTQRTEALKQEIDKHEKAEEEIRALNNSLEQRVFERTVELEKEVSERRRAEDSLRESESRYRLLVDNMPLGITLIDTDHRIVMTNATQAKWFRKDPDLFRQRLCYEHFGTREQVCPHCPAVVPNNGGAFAGGTETEAIRDDGSRFPVRLSTVPIGPAEAPTGYIEVLEDMTRLKESEAEQEKLRQQLIQSKKMEAIGMLAGGVAHDFSNILSVIIGFANIAQLKMTEEDPNWEAVEQILASAQRAETLTQSLLAFSRKQVIHPLPVELNAFIGNLEKMLRRLVGDQVDFRVTCCESPLVVTADPSQLDQVMINLTANARDAMPRGGSILIRTDRVKMEREFIREKGFGEVGDYAMLEVKDTGMGMGEETREKIFEPFFTTKTSGEGTGLGLSTVYGAVTQNHGYVDCMSKPGQGTTFRVYLPLTPHPVQGLSEAPLDVPVGGGNEVLLVADDNDKIRGMFRAVLSDFGYVVITASDGQDALARFLERPKEISLLVIDVDLLKMNGKQVLEEIRKVRPDVKVLLTRVHTDGHIRQQNTVDDEAPLLSKPIRPSQLLRKVREVLDRPTGRVL